MFTHVRPVWMAIGKSVDDRDDDDDDSIVIHIQHWLSCTQFISESKLHTTKMSRLQVRWGGWHSIYGQIYPWWIRLAPLRIFVHWIERFEGNGSWGIHPIPFGTMSTIKRPDWWPMSNMQIPWFIEIWLRPVFMWSMCFMEVNKYCIVAGIQNWSLYITMIYLCFFFSAMTSFVILCFILKTKS